MELDEKIKNIRMANGLSQTEFAARVFVTRQAVSKWEKGRSLPSTESLECIAREFSVPLEELLTPKGRPFSEERLVLARHTLKPLLIIGLSTGSAIIMATIFFLVMSLAFPSMRQTVWRTTGIYFAIVTGVVVLFLGPLFLYAYYPYKRSAIFYNHDGISLSRKKDIFIRYENIRSVSVIPFARFVNSLKIETTGGKVYKVYSLEDANQAKTILESAILDRDPH